MSNEEEDEAIVSAVTVSQNLCEFSFNLDKTNDATQYQSESQENEDSELKSIHSRKASNQATVLFGTEEADESGPKEFGDTGESCGNFGMIDHDNESQKHYSNEREEEKVILT